MHWSEFSVNLSSALLLLKCLGLDVMRMMNRAIKMMFRREKCIIYHFCLIAALNIQTISIPVYKNVICGYFLQPSLVTASPDLNRPGSVDVKNQLGSDMRRPLPWYTDTDTIFRSWPGPGYVSGDSGVSGGFCGIFRGNRDTQQEVSYISNGRGQFINVWWIECSKSEWIREIT